MLDNSYLMLGLDGLSHAHGENYFADGHLGASAIAACYLCRENGLGERTQNAIESCIDREYRGKTPFLPAPDETPDSALLGRLTNTLAGSVGDLRGVGHNIIFGAAALKAFRECPDAITPFRVAGICRLIEDFRDTQNTDIDANDGVPGIAEEGALVEFIFREFLHSVALYAGYGQGWTGHLLTVGHAVLELSRLGYPELALAAHRAYRMYIRTIRRGPRDTDRHIPDHPATTLTPLDHRYWERRKSVRSGLGHAFKYPWSFYSLLARLEDSTLRERCLAESYKIF